MRKTLLLFAVFAALLLVYSDAEAIVSIEGRYWFTEVSSNLQSTVPNLDGTDINLKNTLGIDKAKNFGEARIGLHLGSHSLRYSYMELSWEGRRTLTQSLNFAGQSYAANTSVSSKVDMVYQRMGYRYNFIDAMGNQAGVIFDLKHIGVNANLKAAGINQSSSITLPIPTIGLGGRLGLPFLFSLSAEASGIASGGSYLIDGEVSLNFTPVAFAAISGGYRVFDMKMKSAGNNADFTLQGPFIMVNVEF